MYMGDLLSENWNTDNKNIFKSEPQTIDKWIDIVHDSHVFSSKLKKKSDPDKMVWWVVSMYNLWGLILLEFIWFVQTYPFHIMAD